MIAEIGTLILDGSPPRVLALVCPVYRLFVVLSDQICLDLSKALGRPTPTRPLTMISGFGGTSGHQTQSMEGVQGSRTLGRY